jgi:elongation factor G
MPSAPCDVRNVVLVGHTGAGKTALAGQLLVAAGTDDRAGQAARSKQADRGPDRRADQGDTERHSRSVTMSIYSLAHRGLVVNVIDTPGYADFVGELRAGLRAADTALFVVSAVDAVDGSTKALWEECARVNMPRAIVLTKLDHPRADFAAALAACQDAFGAGVLPLYLPLPDPGAPAGRVSRLLALLSGQIVDYAGGRRSLGAATPEQLASAAGARDALIEGVIAESEDETLLDRYLGGEDLDPAALVDDLETAVARGSFYPVLASSQPGPGGDPAVGAVGAVELLDLFANAFPSPAEHPLPELTHPDGSISEVSGADPDGPLVAEVVRTTTDPYVGKMSVVRVFSGTLKPDTAVHVSGRHAAGAAHRADQGSESPNGAQAGSRPDHDDDERTGALSLPAGSGLRAVDVCPAGGICVVTKLASAETGDTLSDRDAPRHLPAWSIPEPMLPVAVDARTNADEDKLSTALARLAAEDPTLGVEQNAETGQLVLWCMGEAHSEVVLDRLATRFGVAVDRRELRIPLRETVGGSGRGTGRNVKQSGGHGQYAICHVAVEPLPAGAGFEFVDEVVGGAVPRQFIPSVEKGVRAQLARGVLAGYPAVDVRVRLVDGKAHSVDSSDMAFQVAGAMAVKEAARDAGPILLEPVLAVCVLVPDEHVGAVMSDLSARRGRVVGMEPVGAAAGRTAVQAEVPELEMVRYAVDIRSLTQGTGTFTRRHLRYEPLPANLVAAATG